MALFGGLFGHDKEAARVSGAYTDPSGDFAPGIQTFQLPGYSAAPTDPGMSAPALDANGELPPVPQVPQLPPQGQPQGAPQGAPQGLPTPPPASMGGMPRQTPQQALMAPQGVPQGLPTPPPKKRVGAFDDNHFRDTMLALSAGFFGGHSLQEGLASAAKTIAGRNQQAEQEGRPELGGPDGAFEIVTDPVTGQKTYRVVPEFQKYQQDKLAATAASKIKPVPIDKQLDAFGRLVTMANEGKTPEQKQALWEDGIKTLQGLHVDTDNIPANYSPAYARWGASVPQQQGIAAKAEAADEKHRSNLVREGQRGEALAQGAARVSQGAARTGFARDANNRANSNFNNPATVNGVQYRFNPVTGKVQKLRMSQ